MAILAVTNILRKFNVGVIMCAVAKAIDSLFATFLNAGQVGALMQFVD